MVRHLFHGDPAVDGQIDLHAPCLQDHLHDLRVDLHIFRQEDVPAVEVGLGLLLLLPDSLAVHGGPEFLDHGGGEQGLGQEAVHARLEGLLQDIVPAVGGQYDDGGLIAHDLADAAGRLDAVHLRHLPVHQNQIVGFAARMAEPYQLDRLPAGGGGLRVDSRLAQHQLRVLAGDGVVIDDQHAHVLRMDLARLLAVLPAVGVHEGHCDGKDRALPLLALDLDRAVHHLHDTLRDGQAEPGAAVSVGGGGVLLGKGIEDTRQEFRTHADTGIRDGKAQGGLAVIVRGPLHGQLHPAALRREFHRIAQDIDQDLAQFHGVADVIIVDLGFDMALVVQTLLTALAAEEGIDGLQELAEGELLVAESHAAGFDAGHVQDVIDQVQQVVRGRADLLQVAPGPVGQVRVIESDIVQADDGVHGRPDLMAHVGQEGGLGPVGLLRHAQGVAEGLLLLQVPAGLRVDICEAGAHIVDDISVHLAGVMDAREAHHLIGVLPVAVDRIGIGDHAAAGQSLPDRVRLNKAQKFLTIRVCDVTVGVGGDGLQIAEALTDLEPVLDIRMGLVADSFVLVQLQVVDAPEVRRQGRDHLSLLFSLFFLLEQLLLQGQTPLQLLLLDAVLRVRGLFLDSETGCPAVLLNDIGKDKEHDEHGQQGLQDAPADSPL